MWALVGLLIGIPLGVVLNRGDFCMHSALREALSRRPGHSLRAYLVALALQLGFVNALADLQLLQVPLPPVTWVAAAAGGFIFGVGMVLGKG
jgi:uncharacterized membrane protein YedE/YeeE